MRNAVLIAIALASGCYDTEVGYRGGVAYGTYATPSLVYVSPGVQVIADYDEPIFFADSFYWRFYGGRWFRSPYWDRDWVFAGTTVPYSIRSIDRPLAYRHYRPPGYNRPYYTQRPYRQPAPRPNYGPRPYAPPAPPPGRQGRPAPPPQRDRGQPDVRDHR